MSQATKRRKRRILEVRESQIEARVETREFAVRSQTINVDERSIEAVITTETPVMEWDWDRWEMVPRVLLTSGVMLPERNQIPFLDNHRRNTTNDQIGSGRNIRQEKDGVVGRLYFAKDASNQWDKVREGHITDVSGGFEIISQTYIPENTTQRIGGRDFTGPMNVATQWKLREVSLTPIGADEKAKLRSTRQNAFEPQRKKEDFRMNPELKKLLISRGMPVDLDDAKAQEWMLANRDKLFAPDVRTNDGLSNPDKPPVVSREAIDLAIAAAFEAQEVKRKAHRAEVDSLVALTRCEPIRQELYDAPADQLRSKIQDWQAKQSDKGPGFHNPRVTAEGRDTFRKDMSDAIVSKAFDHAGVKQATRDSLGFKSISDASKKLSNLSLSEMARECLIADGFDVRGLTKQEIATAVMSSPANVGLRMDGRDYGGAYHTTGSFAYLTENAVNKSMMGGYVENPGTWRGPMRQGPSVPDFKQVKRYAIGALPNLTAWPDNTEPNAVSLSDFRESYAVEAYAEQISFSWQLLINDDMGALTTVPMKMGAAAARTVNAVAWAVITANATMADTIALFSTATGYRFRANLITGAATPTVATVGAMAKLLRLMRGRNVRLPTGVEVEGPDVLNITPVYIAGPAALEVTINQLVNSAYDPSTGVNHMVHNPTRTLTPIIEPLLDSDSATAWYLFANPMMVDTVEVAFLQGHENPVTWNWVEDATLTRKWGVRQVFCAKALDYRGMVKHAGA